MSRSPKLLQSGAVVMRLVSHSLGANGRVLALVVAVAITFVRVPCATGQSAKRAVEAGMVVGTARPVGALDDVAGAGYAVNLLLQSPGDRRRLGVRAELGYASMRGDRITDAGPSVRQADMRILSGVLSAVLAPASARVRALQPYLIGGAGVYYFEVSGTGAVEANANAMDLGLSVGAGVRFPIGPVRALLEVRFHNAFSAKEPTRFFLPVQLGIAF